MVKILDTVFLVSHLQTILIMMMEQSQKLVKRSSVALIYSKHRY